MKLTRRDALLAVAAGTATSGLGLGVVEQRERSDEVVGRDSLSTNDIETVRAVAEVVFPSEVEATTEFVRTYIDRLHISRTRGITHAIDDLNHATKRRHGRSFASFSPEQGDTILRDIGIHRAQPVADGTVSERIRSYLVNGLLFALFTSPKGSRLVGIQNPTGYPGGYDSYQEGPQ